jgi:hypothetical protein
MKSVVSEAKTLRVSTDYALESIARLCESLHLHGLLTKIPPQIDPRVGFKDPPPP